MKPTDSTIARQKAYIQELKKSNFKFGLTVGTAFVRGIRDIGYKNTGTALDELIDNAYQAGASNAHIVFGFESGKSDKKPSEIAVIDDGDGMIPEMIRASVLWGGTDRQNDRTGFGRYGYGLPSSCVSQGRRYEVYSLLKGEKMHRAVVDLDDIENGKYTNESGDIIIPMPEPAKLPKFVESHIKNHFPKGVLEHGTVVVISKLDKLTWKLANPLQENLLRHLGVVYHKLRANLDLWINDTRVEPIDPLFLTSGYRWYDFDADRAQALEPMRIEVKDKETRENLGHINVRFSYMPLTFASIEKGRKADKKNANPRSNVLTEYNGFIIARMGRIMDVVRHSPLTTFVNNDRYIKIEIDFPATLDEEFNVSTSKQRVDVSDRIWDILEENGLLKALEQLRKKRDEEKAKQREKQESKPNEKRASEEAMERASQIIDIVPTAAAEEKRLEQGRRRLQQEAEKRAADTGKTIEQAEREIEAELAGRLYKVGHRTLPGGAFFEVEQIGGTKVLWLNTASKFYQEVHSGPDSNPAVRSALEILLFSIGDRILEGSNHLKDFYAHEVPEWSKKLEFALGQLAQNIGAADPDEIEESRG